THRSLSQLLPRDAARELRLAYHSRAYPEAAGIGRAAWRQFEAAMDMPDLSDDLQSAIEALAFSHEMSQLRISEQVIDLLDARRRDIALRDLVRRNSEDERTQAMDELRARADQADEAALSNLHNMLGPEL